MVYSIYKKLLEKHTLEELKDGIPAEKSLERLVSSSPVPSTPKSPLPLADSPKRKSIWENYGYPIFFAAVIGIWGGVAHIGKRDSRYEFNGYVDKFENNINVGKEKVRFYETWLQNTDRIEVEREDGTKIIYLSSWSDDDEVDEVISVKPNGEEITICDNDVCLKEATSIARDYKTKIIDEKEKPFKEQFKEHLKE